MNKTLPSLIILAMGVIVVIELSYIDKTSLAWVLIVMALSIGALAYLQMQKRL